MENDVQKIKDNDRAMYEIYINRLLIYAGKTGKPLECVAQNVNKPSDWFSNLRIEQKDHETTMVDLVTLDKLCFELGVDCKRLTEKRPPDYCSSGTDVSVEKIIERIDELKLHDTEVSINVGRERSWISQLRGLLKKESESFPCTVRLNADVLECLSTVLKIMPGDLTCDYYCPFQFEGDIGMTEWSREQVKKSFNKLIEDDNNLELLGPLLDCIYNDLHPSSEDLKKKGLSFEEEVGIVRRSIIDNYKTFVLITRSKNAVELPKDYEWVEFYLSKFVKHTRALINGTIPNKGKIKVDTKEDYQKKYYDNKRKQVKRHPGEKINAEQLMVNSVRGNIAKLEEASSLAIKDTASHLSKVFEVENLP